MVIIIEGVDGVGKTTLSKKFSEKYNFEYIKESYTDDCKEKEKRIQLILERVMSNKNYIYDRTTLIDDFVYSFLNIKQSSLSKYLKIIDAILSKCKIFHLTIDENIRKERFEKRGDQYITNDMIEKIQDEYYKFYYSLENSKVISFPLSDNLEIDIEKMMEVIKND